MTCVLNLKKLRRNTAIDVGQSLPFPLHGNTNIMVINKNVRIELTINIEQNFYFLKKKKTLKNR